ncbi:MAG: hypothetical protein QM713_10665 [Arachnia sp.]
MPPEPHAVDLAAYARRLGREWVALVVAFVLVLAAGAAWVLTRPVEYVAAQTLAVTLPTAETEADAIQQGAALPGAVAAMVSLALTPGVMAPVLAAHADIPDVEALTTRVTVGRPTETLLAVSATAATAEEATRLAGDVGAALRDATPTLVPDTPPHLRFGLEAVAEPAARQAPSGRLTRLAAVGVLALLVAVGAAEVAAGVRRRRARR